MFTLLETYDLFRFTEPFGERLDALAAELEARDGFPREKAWMVSAREAVSAVAGDAAALLPRLRELPELGAAREEHAVAQIGPWVDALEKLLAGITFHFGSRAPVIEALFPHLKLMVLRRPNLDEARSYGAEFERRLRSAYVERIFGQDDWSFVRDVVAQVRAAYAPIGEAAPEAAGAEAERQATVEAALAHADVVERVLAQARLVAEAALLPFEGVFAGSGLSARPKRRGGRASKSSATSKSVLGEAEVEIAAPARFVNFYAAPEDEDPAVSAEPPSVPAASDSPATDPATSDSPTSDSPIAEPSTPTVEAEVSAEALEVELPVVAAEDPAVVAPPPAARKGRRRTRPPVAGEGVAPEIAEAEVAAPESSEVAPAEPSRRRRAKAPAATTTAATSTATRRRARKSAPPAQDDA